MGAEQPSGQTAEPHPAPLHPGAHLQRPSTHCPLVGAWQLSRQVVLAQEGGAKPTWHWQPHARVAGSHTQEPLPWQPRAERAEDLRAYLDKLLNQEDEGRLLGDASFQSKALGLEPTSPFAAALGAIANERARRANEARAAAAAEQAAILKQQQDDCAFAQTFNSALAYQSIAPGALTTVVFPRSQRFELRNKFWGWGDAEITGPGGLPWFKMHRTNASIFGELLKNAHFAICTNAGEPLLVLQERFQWMNYEYDLFRIDPRTRLQIPVCKIVRRWTFMSFTDQYEVQLFGPGIHGMCPVQCAGRWPSQFTLHTNGQVAATVNKQMFSFTDKYHVEIGAGCDVLLYLGIACAIDRIHHEVEDERARRRR